LASNSFSSFSLTQNSGATGAAYGLSTVLLISSTGFTTAFANEQGDGTHANTFNANSINLLMGNIWL
jgi:hypothetical protein